MVRKILGVLRVYLGIFKKTKEKKDRAHLGCRVGSLIELPDLLFFFFFGFLFFFFERRF